MPVSLEKKLRIKYSLSKVAAFFLLLLAAPLFLILAFLIKLGGLIRPQDQGPVFYKEPRVSEGKVFQEIKFRTIPMEVVSWIREEPETRSMSGQVTSRTWAGKIISTWYLDELPQLVNILRGEMTLVGPRPQLISFYKKINSGSEAPPLQILKGGLLGIPQACKRFEKFRSIFKDMADEYRIDQKRWNYLDSLYLEKIRGRSVWGILAFDIFLIMKGLRTVLAGEDPKKFKVHSP